MSSVWQAVRFNLALVWLTVVTVWLGILTFSHDDNNRFPRPTTPPPVTVEAS